MSQVQVSIIMPVYNGEAVIADAIMSVIRQSFKNWELIIVDDCSIDSTEEAVNAIVDNRVHFYRLSENTGGPTSPRNFGLSVSRGKYIAFLDADDLWEPYKLQIQVDILESGYNVVCSNYTVFVEEPFDTPLSHRRFPERFGLKNMLKRNCIGNLTGIYNRENLGIVLQKELGHEDYIMWLELVKRCGEVYCVQESLAKYRLSKGSLSSDKVKAAKWQWSVYRNELKLGLTKSCYYFMYYVLKSVKGRFFSTD